MQLAYTQPGGHIMQRKSSLGADTVPQECNDQVMEDEYEADPALQLIIADDGSIGDDSMNSSEENDVIDDRSLGAQIKIADLTVFR